VRRSLTAIAGLGMVAALFLAMMSMIYLGKIRGKEDVRLLEEDLRAVHGVYLSALSPMKITMVRPTGEGGSKGLVIDCRVRPDLANSDSMVEFHLDRIAQSALDNPGWKGFLDYVTVNHNGPKPLSRTRRAVAQAAATG